MSTTEAFVAATRFGLGARPRELSAVAGDPRGWLSAQLGPGPNPDDLVLQALPASAGALSAMVAARGGDEGARQSARDGQRDRYTTEQVAHLTVAATTDTPFRERWVALWTHHFAVSISRAEVLGLATAFEREVVRAHLDGPFSEMLLASTRHPAMLAYLDNARSTGPTSRAGVRSGRGLNENLAREVLELHTLGVHGGYGQHDVRALAEILTGWTVDRSEGPGTTDEPARFQFDSNRHEPGDKMLLGGRIRHGGADEGEQALARLAGHPATATHIATKLVRHFVHDDPPAAAVAIVRDVFVETEGDLPSLGAAVIGLDAAWEEPLTKLKSPRDLVISAARALNTPSPGPTMLRALRTLGQLPQQAPSPQGWPDVAAAWLGSQAVLDRVEWAEEVAARHRRVDALALAAEVLGPVLSTHTSDALRGAPAAEALTLLLASPEFQRR